MVTKLSGLPTRTGIRMGFPRSLKTVGKILLRALLISTVITAALVFGTTTIPAVLGLKTMVVTSGSMEPAIRAGDATIIRTTPVDSLRVGDVITYGSVGGEGMTTHRIIAISEIDGTTFFQTKGDFNNTPDPNLTPTGAVYGRVVVTLPKLGRLLFFSATALGKLLVIGTPLLILMASEFKGLPRPRKPTPAGEAHVRAV